jgi:hypothetical protein
MDDGGFDRLARALATARPRRSITRVLSGLALVGSRGLSGAPGVGAGTKKLKRNQFGCVNVGNACRGKDGACCSGICRGKKPKKGKKDRSRCVAQDEGGCRAGSRIPACGGAAESCTTSAGASGLCGTTTGKAGFCSQGFICASCTRDDQCRPSPDPNAACVLCATCPSGRACAVP